MCHGSLRVVVERVTLCNRFAVLEVHIIIEHCLLVGGGVLSPVAREAIVTVYEPSSIEEISHGIESVVV